MDESPDEAKDWAAVSRRFSTGFGDVFEDGYFLREYGNTDFLTWLKVLAADAHFGSNRENRSEITGNVRSAHKHVAHITARRRI